MKRKKTTRERKPKLVATQEEMSQLRLASYDDGFRKGLATAVREQQNKAVAQLIESRFFLRIAEAVAHLITELRCAELKESN